MVLFRKIDGYYLEKIDGYYLEVMTSSQKVKKGGHSIGSARELGVANATRAIWLVKVPNYVAALWKTAGPDAELGKMRITESSKAKEPDMSFILSEDLAKAGAIKAGLEIPREHRLQIHDTSRQSLSGFSESLDGMEKREVLAEGKVIQRAELQPLDSEAYRKFKQ